MSIQMFAWAFNQDIPDARAKLILLAIADAHNEGTGQCNPSQTVLAQKASCSRRTVISKIQWLENQGWIKVFSRKNERGRASNFYKIMTEEVCAEISHTGGEVCETDFTGVCATGFTANEPEIRTLIKKEKYKKEKVGILEILKEAVDIETAGAIIDHRKALRKPLTIRAAKLLANEFLKTNDPVAAANKMILYGWQGFKASWEKPCGKAGNKKSNTETALEALQRL